MAKDVAPSEKPADVRPAAQVRIANLQGTTVHVELVGGEPVRLGPKEVVVVEASQVSDAVRRLVAEGHLVINTLL